MSFIVIKNIKQGFRVLLVSTYLLLAINLLASAKNSGNTARKTLVDSGWKFFLGDSASFSQKTCRDAHLRTLDLPHDWSIEGQVHLKNPAVGSGGYFPTGIGWYRKTFRIPSEWKNKCVSVYFEGVYMNSEVFVNGKYLGLHPFGYTSFQYDLSPYLAFGSDNTLAVRVDNSQQLNTRWYSGSGIYRHVWMVVTEPVHIAQWGLGITTPVVTSQKATVQVKSMVRNETAVQQEILVKTSLSDSKSKNKGGNQLKLIVPAKSEKEVIQVVEVSNPQLWSPNTPHLYQAKVEILKNKKVVDVTETNFGIRTLKFSAEHGFELNGRVVKINGGCVHHDNGSLGAAAYDRAEERKIELLKTAGFNAVRTSHNPPSEAFLNACDRLGLLVMDEPFDCWRVGKNKYDYSISFDRWWKRDLEAMVLRDRNHPSIFMWSIGNEIPERGTPDAVNTANMLVDALKKMDDTRPITSAIVVNDKKWEVMDTLMAVHDVAGYNYHLHSAPTDHQRVPSRIIVQTESYPKDALANWELVQKNSYVIGDFVWTAMDYLGESGLGRYFYSNEVAGECWERDMFPWHGAYCGDIDLIGWRKPISHYRSMLYNDTEKLYLAVREPAPAPLEIKETWWSVWPTWESWTWPGFEGKTLQVEVYSKYPSIRLYLNDKLVGEQAPAGLKAIFTLSYVPGVLKAVGVEKNREVESTNLQTAGDASRIRLKADRKELLANGQDLAYINVELTDKNDLFQPNAANLLQFKVEGEGTIVGVGNADLKDCDAYVANTRKAWKGRAQVIIKSTGKPGTIQLTVQSPSMSQATLNLNSIGQ